MKLFIHEGNGHYIGSTVIVWAENKDSAYKIIRKELNSMGLKDEEPFIIPIKLISKEPCVVYSNSGDY